MMFSENSIKLPSGKNFSLKAQSCNLMNLFFSNNNIEKRLISLGVVSRVESAHCEYKGDYLKELSNSKICLCNGTSVSILEND